MRPTNSADAEFAPRVVFRADGSKKCGTLAMGVLEVDACDNVLRVHNGCRDGGGFTIPMFSNCPDENGNLPVAPLAPVPAVAVEAVDPNAPEPFVLTYIHNKGAYPIVQVLVNGEVQSPADYPVTHTDTNSFTVTYAPGSPASQIIVAF